jgi:hypothetical protein
VSVVALSTGVEAAWWASIGAGLVVAVVVWALLETLRRTVKRVGERVDEVLAMGGRLAQNTATVHTLQMTRDRALELHAELEQHRGEGRSAP